MTMSDDFNFAEQSGELNLDAPTYPVLFGISFTPKIIGIIIGVVGLAGGLYLLLNLVMPAWENFQQQQTKANDLQSQIDQKKVSLKQIDKVKEELNQAKQQKIQVLGLFSNEKTLDTLLLDINRLVDSGNVQTPSNPVRAKLQKFVPVTQKPEPITDGSLGTPVDGKLKRSIINIEIVGNYEQTQSIIRNIERLQPLLIFKEYQSKSIPPEPISPSDKQVRRSKPQITINTSFQLQALIPLTTEEIAAMAKPAAKK